MLAVASTNLDPDLIRNVVKNYNVLDYTHNLRRLLNEIVPNAELEAYERVDIHKKINELALDAYEGEQVLKYKLFKAFSDLDLVAAYEIRVRNSRVDFLTINGHTTSYEIKSSLDNLDKLAKQSRDYLGAFELNNIVLHERHLGKCLNIIPNCFGIITITKNSYKVIRKPVLNRFLDANVQLSLLTKKELLEFFGSSDAEEIVSTMLISSINERFKLALKKRYLAKWKFVVYHKEEIMPMDVQFFFNKNISPSQVYG